MSIKVVVGTNWGDEGKGRIVDYLAQDADVVVRYQGGNNAGHTVVNRHGTFRLHLIPSGIFNPDVTNILGTGMVIDLEALCDEITALESAGINCKNLAISERATVCFPFNAQEDEWEEERLGRNAFGSTKVGIAPAYGDRYEKKAIQLGEIRDISRLEKRLERLTDFKELVAGGVYGKSGAISSANSLEWLKTNGSRIEHLICDTSRLLDRANAESKRIIFEAQLGALRDVFYGVYPFTSSSHCLSSFVKIGAGVFGVEFDEVIGVLKAFSTCVGAGPLVTEMDESKAGPLREIGNEYGAKTGRPRRIGHFDAVASRYGAKLQEVDSIALTKLDCLSGIDPLLICTHYEFNGKKTDRFPLNFELENCTPVYQELRGWSEDISSVREYRDLPSHAQKYVAALESHILHPLKYVSVGCEREAMIVRSDNH